MDTNRQNQTRSLCNAIKSSFHSETGKMQSAGKRNMLPILKLAAFGNKKKKTTESGVEQKPSLAPYITQKTHHNLYHLAAVNTFHMYIPHTVQQTGNVALRMSVGSNL